MGLKFIPPKAQGPRYASYAHGVMKTHSSTGNAKQSLAYRCRREGDAEFPGQPFCDRPKVWSEGFILESIKGEWYILHHVKNGTKDNELPWKRDVWIGRWGSRHYSKPNWESNDLTHRVESYSMSKEEYAEWRIRVELEKRGIVDGEEA